MFPEYDTVLQALVIFEALLGSGLFNVNSTFSELDDDEVFYPPPVTSALSHATSNPKLIFDINVLNAVWTGVL